MLKTNRGLFASIFNKNMFITLLLGFSSGLPLILTGSTLQAMMTDSGISLGTIGLFSLVGLPYSIKFLFAPFFDRYLPPILDRRRGWILLCQFLLLVSIFFLGFCSPVNAIHIISLLAFCTALFSALQDIVIDAYRRELFTTNELGLANSLSTTGYRVAMLFSGAFALLLADHMSWKYVYMIMGSTMVVGMFTTLFAPTELHGGQAPRTLEEAIIGPFKEYFSRKNAITILLFILLYKIGDMMCSAMTTPFILKMGFTKTELATIVKTFGLISLLVGGLAGGIVMLRIGLNRSLWLFGILQMFSILGFSYLAHLGHDIHGLIAVIAIENLSFGMGTSAFTAFMASVTDTRFTATQFALLTSMMSIPRVLIAAPTGYAAGFMGWQNYFLLCAMMGIPGLLLLYKFAPITLSQSPRLAK